MEGAGNPRLFAWLNEGSDAAPRADLSTQVTELERLVQTLREELVHLRQERRAPVAHVATQTEEVSEPPQPAKSNVFSVPGHKDSFTRPSFNFGTGKMFTGRCRSTGDAMRDFLMLDFHDKTRSLSVCVESRRNKKKTRQMASADADHVADYSSAFTEARWLMAGLYRMSSKRWCAMAKGRVSVPDGKRFVLRKHASKSVEEKEIVEARVRSDKNAVTVVVMENKKPHLWALLFENAFDRDRFIGMLRVKVV